MKKKSNPNLIKIINFLNDGAYHDGETLGKSLNMTRSAVWKNIKKLQAYGIKIEAVKRKGYILEKPLHLLDLKKIKPLLKDKHIKLNLFEDVDSTNNYLQNLKPINKNICLAEKQSAGRGRLGRPWSSPFGKNIYLSCAYSFQKDLSELAGLSLVVSLSIVECLQKLFAIKGFCLKWPNDILYDKKKLSGVLIDVQAESNGYSHTIIGVGLNVNMNSIDAAINQPFTSLQEILNICLDRNEICAAIINSLLEYLQDFEKYGFKPFANLWQEYDYLQNKEITLNHACNKIKGKVKGVTEKGYLLMQVENGGERVFSSGETSISKEN